MNREQSRFINLRNFHNRLKGMLIYQTVNKLKKPVNLFDISVGRMGDYHSWNRAGIDFVFAIDPDVKAIGEAKKRFYNLKKKHHNKTFVNLGVGKITDDKFNIDFPRVQVYDIVSCQFSIHYFFENQNMLDNALYRISYTLKKGGYFIGTTIDGCKLNELFKHEEKIVKENYYKIQKKYNKFEMPFGNKYTFNMYDIDNTGLYFTRESDEYLVSKQVLIQACEHFKLKLVEIKDFENWEIKHEMTIPEKEISFMYFSFVFQKI